MRRCTAAEAASHVRSTDTLVLPLGPAQPPAFLGALGRRESFESLTVLCALLLDSYALFTRPGVRLLSGFYGPVERELLKAGHDVEFVPSDFRRYGPLAKRLHPRVMATALAPPDASGRFSLSLHAGATVDELSRCGRDPDRILIGEVNSRLPRTLGLPPEHVHGLCEDEIDLLIEIDRPLPVAPEGPPNDVDRAIAAHARDFVPDGATLQTGIGAIPNTVVSLLAEGDGGDYGIHSEMFTTSLMRLHRAGKVTNRKGIHDGLSIATFALGSEELYEWLDGQDLVRFLPVERVNGPEVIARNRNFVSVNGALSVDLAGQIAADNLGGRQYSGIGGHEDFVSAATFSPNGRSLVCLPSVAEVGGERVSRIQARFQPGTTVTSPRHQVDVVITEHGAAELSGLTEWQRREALIAVAHPDFRAVLEAEAGGHRARG